jgi:hypothetical protein
MRARWRPSGSPAPRAGWPRRTSTRESATARRAHHRATHRGDNPASRPVRSSCQGRHEPGRQGSTHVVAVRPAHDARTLSAAAAPAAVDADGQLARRPPSRPTTGPPQTAARRPAGPGSPRADHPADRPRREPGPGPRGPGPDRRPRPPRDGRTPPDAPRGRTTDHADRTVPGGTGAHGQLRPARRSARRATGPAAWSAGHGAENEPGSAQRCPPDTARARRGRRARQSGGSARSRGLPPSGALTRPRRTAPGARQRRRMTERILPLICFPSSMMNGFAEA